MQPEDDLATADLRPRPARKTPGSAPDLPGCRPMPLPRQRLDAHDGRFEYWDGDTDTAWVACDPTGLAHEGPSERLVELCSLIAAARGAPIGCFGSTDLELRDERGERRRILQADQCVYLYPGRARLPEDGGVVVGEHDCPDVVLEVDHTTDVRPWKLGMYESWGFPELWVEVPKRWSRRRRRGRTPGLTIHVLEDGAYRESARSRAFPGWPASAIHAALNEAEPTGWTHARLEQVGRRLGERDGVGPDDHPLMRSLRDQSRAEGRAKMLRQILVSRGIALSEAFPADLPGFAESPEEEVVAAALACDGEGDFRARLRGGPARE